MWGIPPGMFPEWQVVLNNSGTWQIEDDPSFHKVGIWLEVQIDKLQNLQLLLH